MIRFYSFLMFLFALGACEKGSEGLVELRSGDITGLWIHSYEENAEGAQVYRREDFAFPPSRGRERFELFDNGKVTYYAIAPADGYDAYQGTWSLQGDILKLVLPEPLNRSLDLKVLQLEPDKLVVKEN